MSDPTAVPLAADFPAATHADWRKLVDAVLKGAPFSRLESKTADGLGIEPLYPRAPSAQPVVGRAAGRAWTLMQRVDHPDPAAANAQALDDLGNGATGLVLVFTGSVTSGDFGLDAGTKTISRVLDGIFLDAGIAIDLNISLATRNAARDFAAVVKRLGIAPRSIDLRAGINPIGGLAASGRSALPWRSLAPHFAALVGELADAGFRGPFAVADGRIVHNAGGSEAQELAFVLGSAVAYLRALEASGLPLEAARDAIYFRLAADAEQLMTMAKFRAARKLWGRIEQACGLSPKPVLIAAETAWRMMTRRDAYTNLLRTTIAVAAAGFGGADAITVLPHTAALGLPDALARRMARNTQLLLLEESNLARVADPAAGAGAVEAVTQELCAAAWSQFQRIEHGGGIWRALETGAIQDQVAAVCADRQSALARRTEILTGTNQYPDLHETTPAVLAVAPRTPPDDGAAAMACVPLPRIRLGEPFERLRDNSDTRLEQTGARPRIYLATLGTQAEFAPRANFARNFFEAGGIEAVAGSSEAADPAAAFRASGATLACLCASDKGYGSEGLAAAAALKKAGARHIYLAGRPGKDEAAYRQAGIATFIFAGCDALAVLEAAYGFFG